LIELKEIPYGIGCRVGNVIYINKNLREQDVGLYIEIFKHELQHSPTYTLEDIKIDLRNKHLRHMKWRYYKFILRNPSSWIEFLPFWVYNHHLIVNPLILGFYGLTLAIIGGILWVLK
jgi:hypothetical protein